MFCFPADLQIDPVIRDRQSAAFDLCGGHLLRDLRSVLCPCIPADIRGLLLDRERCERAVIYSVTEKNKSNDGAPNP